jgi:hypothetical protein
MEDVMAEEFCYLSLNAIAGTDANDCIRIRALVKNKVMLALLDSGSSHSFISSNSVQQTGLATMPTTPKRVRLANGEVIISDKIVPSLEWWCQGHTITGTMRVLDLGAYDAIL